MSFLPKLAGAARVGAAVYRTEMATNRLPSALGRVIKDHTEKGGVHEKHEMDNEILGYHGTTLKRVDSQIAQGHFDRRGEDIYFGDEGIAEHFGCKDISESKENKPVILLIGSKHAPGVDQTFNTTYFPKENPKPVKIYKAYEVNPEYVKEVDARKDDLPGQALIGAIGKAWNASLSVLFGK